MAEIPVEIKKQMDKMEAIRDVIDRIKKMDKRSPLKEMLEFTKKHFAVNADEINQIEGILEGKVKAKKDPERDELLTDLHHYIGLARLTLRKHDPENPDLEKIKIAVNNRLARLRSEAGLTKARQNKKS